MTMSRKKKHGNDRRRRREMLRARHVASRENGPWAPARWNFFGKVRKGEVAMVSINFQGPVVPVDLEVKDPGESLREATLVDAWASEGFPVSGES